MTQDTDESISRGFKALWPTLFLQRNLPGCDQANELLAALVMSREATHQTTDYREQDLLSTQHPATEWLKTCINKTVADYLAEQGIGYSIDWSLQGWANINRTGDYHGLHNHPHSYLSGTYYVQVPDQPSNLQLRNDINPGDISFFDPRSQANMLAIADDGQIEAEHRVTPSPGMILLWPAFLHHLVHPNHAEQERISISFNIVLKWTDEFLPEQT